MKHVFYFSLQIFFATFSAHMKFGRVSRRNARRSAISFGYFCPIFTWSMWANFVQPPNLIFLENVSAVVDLRSNRQMNMTRLTGAL